VGKISNERLKVQGQRVGEGLKYMVELNTIELFKKLLVLYK